METRGFRMNFSNIGLYLCAAAICFTYSCDARSSSMIIKSTEKFKVLKRFGTSTSLMLDSSSNTQPPNGVSSPFSFDSLAPIPSPDNPYCLCPSQPPSPSTTIPTPPRPVGTVVLPSPQQYYFPSPNPPESVLSPPKNKRSPPPIHVPSPTEPTYGPPPFYDPSPPSPTIFVPSPPVFQPPVVYPPPTRRPPPPPPPPHTGPSSTLWCVAKPSVPEPIIQEAMNYACGSGADCDPIQPNESCFEPNTVIAHASYAFNSYWQSTKAGGSTCEFGGAAMLVSVDPSNDGCHFIYY